MRAIALQIYTLVSIYSIAPAPANGSKKGSSTSLGKGGGPSFPRKKRIKAGRGEPPTVVSDRASPGIRDLRIRDRWVGFFVI